MHSCQGAPSCSVGASIAGGPMPSADEIRDVQRATWAGLSAGWEKWDSVIMEMISEHVSVAAAALRKVEETARERIARSVSAKVSTYEEDGRVRIPGVARCIAGTK